MLELSDKNFNAVEIRDRMTRKSELRGSMMPMEHTEKTVIHYIQQ